MQTSAWLGVEVPLPYYTNQEPLVVHIENPSSDEQLANFNVGHTRSQGRTLSLLALLWYCYKHTVTLQDFATRQQSVVYFSF